MCVSATWCKESFPIPSGTILRKAFAKEMIIGMNIWTLEWRSRLPSIQSWNHM